MKLSKRCEYALRALTRLASPAAAAKLSIQEIARQEAIPKKFLEQVLLGLKQAGIVRSSRGRTGGYTLRGAPDRVTLGEIVAAVDGPLASLPCTNPTAPVQCAECLSMEDCWLRALMTQVGDAVAAVLDQVTLADMSRRAHESRLKSTTVLSFEI